MGVGRLSCDRLYNQEITKEGYKVKIVEYKNCHEIIVEFECGYRKSSDYRSFKNGTIQYPFSKNIFNKGYIGVGKYNSTGTYAKYYAKWRMMFERCYYEEYLLKRSTYRGCEVCEEWHNFQNFAKWHEENYYEISGEIMCLDKDILIKGNKIYSPDTCIFVPERINVLFTKRQSDRGDCPIGINYHKRDNTYECRCNHNGKSYYLGRYDSKVEAFKKYKTFKENSIKQVADEYKDKIPQKLYDAMYRYEVEITD